MSNISAFPKIYNLGHRAIENLFKGEVEITEKLDGSQFAFGITEKNDIVMRSKGQELFSRNQNKMFNAAIDQVDRVESILRTLYENNYRNSAFQKSYTFYCEYLEKPKHNCLAYERTPKNNLALFGVKIGENFVSRHEDLSKWAELLDIDVVPIIYKGVIDNNRVMKSESGNVNQEKKFGYTAYEKLKRMIEQTMSYLGNVVIEGIVVKNYDQLTTIGPPTLCFGKFVREDFKEKLHKEWHKISGRSKIDDFIEGFRTEARWKKAIAHLREKGELTESPKDIGSLMKEVHLDIINEEKEFIKDGLYKIFVDNIKRKSIAGLAEWYKDQLMKNQFEGELK